jgi:endonuclease/exonuclease/phosphatase family metal-dependent hydrolase
MNAARTLLALIFSLCACGPVAPDEVLPELEQVKTDAPTASAFCAAPGTPEETGLLQLVNDPALAASDLQAAGIDIRAAQAIVAARPIVTLAALDALPYVGLKACSALRASACAQQRCTTGFSALTWNIDLFPHSTRAADKVLAQLKTLAPDVVAFEEILDPAAFQAMAAQLPGYQVVLAERGWDSGVGALVKSTVTLLGSQSLHTGDSYAFPRPVLRLSLQLAAGQKLDLMVVHLKAQLDATSVARRRAAITKLAAELAAPATPTVIVGDWNDQITDPAAQNVFAPLLDAGFTFLTLPLAQSGKYSYAPFHSFLDHVAVDGSGVRTLRPYVTDVLTLDKQDSAYVTDVTDHDPVLTRFSPN